jgi:hypothetical protein
MQIHASDAGTPRKTSECPVTIRVLEESKYAPDVRSMSIAVNSYLGEFPGAQLTQIMATDRDARDVLSYRLVPTGE